MFKMIIRDFLQNLKERSELDYTFPILLEQMNYSILKSAESSIGQPEYGKDIVALNENRSILYIFQLKAGNDKDVNAKTCSGKNGIKESLQQARDVEFPDSTIQGLNELPRKILLVHTGELNNNYRPAFDGFIKREFIKNQFERWDIYKLTELYSKYMLNEYILTDSTQVRLLKKTLAFIDVPENDFSHLQIMLKTILSENNKYKYLKFKKMIATLCVISHLILQYSEESNNLRPARDCLTFILLQVWGWILEKKIEKNENAIEEFLKLQSIHFKAIDAYVLKIIPIAEEQSGLFNESGGYYEEIGYPLRCQEILSYIIYHLFFHVIFLNKKEDKEKITNYGIQLIETIISNNTGCIRLLLDNHSITIILVVKLYQLLEENDKIKRYIEMLLNNLAMIKSSDDRLPEMKNDIFSLIDFVANGKRPASYSDKSSYLILIVFELLVNYGTELEFNKYWKYLTKELHLLTFYPPSDIIDNEHILFQKELKEEGYTDVFEFQNEQTKKEVDKKSDFQYLKDNIQNKKEKEIKFRTDEIGFLHLRILAHIYYKTPFLPSDWRMH